MGVQINTFKDGCPDKYIDFFQCYAVRYALFYTLEFSLQANHLEGYTCEPNYS